MHQSDLYKRIRAEVDKVKLIDTHEHQTYPHDLAEMKKIDFGRFFTHYASCDLRSAGMPPEDMTQVADENSKWTTKKKWQALKPYYEKSWNTGYCECLRIAMRDLYGIEDLRDDTIELLSEKMNAVPRKTWTRKVFDKAGIDIALQNNTSPGPVYARIRYPELYLYDMSDEFTGFGSIGVLSKDSGIDVYGLSDYLRVIDWYFDKYADEASAFKIGRAYDRTLFFEDVPFGDAERVFNELRKFNNRPARRDIQALEDFIVHHIVRRCGEYNLPVKFHTGLQEGNSNNITNSRAILLTNLFMKYPKTKFDIYHISWPYTEELINACKNFPNVTIDFCWAWIFNPPASRRYLADMLETVPLNKIHGFGGDFIFVEGTYGHSQIARRGIAQVLTKKVKEGRFSEEYAVKAAQRLLRENALENFRVEEKRKVFAKRAKE